MIDIVHRLRRAKGSNAKKAILEEQETNELWQSYLLAVYNPHINYYVSGTTETTFLKPEECTDERVRLMLNDLKTLSSRTFTGNLARDYAYECSEKYGELFRLVLGGSLKAGISVTTINNVYAGLIPTFPVMLGMDVDKVRYPVFVSVKYDGVRVIVIVMNKHVTVYTRGGKELPIKSLIESMKCQPNGVYDGELVAGEGKMVGRTKITGKVNKVLKGTLRDFTGYTFMVFDYLTTYDWLKRHSRKPFINRYSFLETNFNQAFTNVGLVEQKLIAQPGTVDALFEEYSAKGYEGLILRYADDPYIWGRSKALIKKKAVKEFKLKCYAVQEGRGKYEGMIGALMCHGKVEGVDVDVKVGSGLDDYDRDQVPEHYVGSEIEGLYNSIVKNQHNEGHSLFLPRFKRVVGGV